MRRQAPLVLTSLILCVSWGVAQDAGKDARRFVVAKAAIADRAVLEDQHRKRAMVALVLTAGGQRSM